MIERKKEKEKKEKEKKEINYCSIFLIITIISFFAVTIVGIKYNENLTKSNDYLYKIINDLKLKNIELNTVIENQDSINYFVYLKIIKEDIKRRETFSPRPYICVDKREYIGYGHLNKENYTFLNPEEGIVILDKDIDIRIKYLKKKFKLKNYDIRVIPLMSLYYRVGEKMFLTFNNLNNIHTSYDFLKYIYYKEKGEVKTNLSLQLSAKLESIIYLSYYSYEDVGL